MRFFLVLAALWISGPLGLAPLAQADGPSRSSGQARARGQDSSEATKQGSKGRRPQAITAQRESATLEFVSQHHAELAELLGHLKKNRPSEYGRAIRELSRNRERLEQIRQRDSERYELELQAWKLHSRVQLLAARLTMNNSGKLHEQLKQALDEQLQIRRTILQGERQRLAERLGRIDEQLEKMEQQPEQIIERQMRALTAGSGRSGPGQPPASATETRPGSKRER